MNIKIRTSENNLKSKKKFMNDEYFQKLIEYLTNNHTSPRIHNFTRYLFYAKSGKEYDILLKKFLNKNTQENDLQHIHNLFSKWKPYEKYNLANCRGAFLEELSYNMLKEKNPSTTIHTETQILLEDYQSHYWDILIIGDIIKAYECKFSAYSIKRKHIDKMWEFKNKIINSKVFLIVYDNEKIIKQKIMAILHEADILFHITNNIDIISIKNFHD